MANIQEVIDDFIKEAEAKQKDLEELKITINNLCKRAGLPLKYETVGDIEETQQTALQGDEFHNKPMATVITEILQYRKRMGMGPATIEEIRQRMADGGYAFTGIKDVIVAVGTAMGKNLKFRRLPNNKWGLAEWYGIKERRPKNPPQAVSSEVEQETTPVAGAEQGAVVLPVSTVKQTEQPKKRGRPSKSTEQTDKDKQE
jgi:DNA-directed RNA polymerase delta subunit